MNATVKLPRLLTPADVADLLRVGESTIYRALTEGRLPATKPLGRWRIPADELEQWIRDQRPLPHANSGDPMPQPVRDTGPANRLLGKVVELRRSAS